MNYWDILGIAPTTDKRTIRKAYAKLLKEYHPEERPEKFEEINNAYQAAMSYADYAGYEASYLYEHEEYEEFKEDEGFADLSEEDYDAQEPYTHLTFNVEEFNDSIFHVDEEYEESVRKEQEEMQAVLDRLAYLLSLKDNAVTDSGKKRRTELLKFINEQFEPYKHNPVFIHSLVSLLFKSENLNYKYMKAIKKVFDIKGKDVPVYYDSELDYALYQLNKELESFINGSSGIRTPAVYAAIFGVIIIAISLIQGLDTQTNQSLEPSLPRPSNLHYMGSAYRIGRSGREQDYERAIYWYRRAIEQNYAPSQFNLGLMYANGQGVEQSYTEAVYWFRKAAGQGHSSAQHSLGLMYDQGWGISQNYEQAAYWYRKAAREGNIHSQNNLGVLYLRGHGLEVNYEQAAYWFRQSAESGFAYAQLNLGLMYEFGQGVPQDLERAKYWYEKAVAGGSAPALEALNRVLEQSD